MDHREYQTRVASLIDFYNLKLGGPLSDLRLALLSAVFEAGQVLTEAYGKAHPIERKGIRDFATLTDIKVETGISQRIRSQFPSYQILGEETGSSGESSYQWIVDPVDGTFNFALGIPFFAVSVGLVHHAQTVLGAIYDPIRNELFFAQKGNGAWLNTQPVLVSTRKELSDSSLGLDLYYDTDAAIRNVDIMRMLIPSVRTQRVLGCAALGMAYVGCGRLDAYYHNYILPWDVAAGQLIVEEAQGRVTDFLGMTYDPLAYMRTIVATNGLLHNTLVSQIVSLANLETS